MNALYAKVVMIAYYIPPLAWLHRPFDEISCAVENGNSFTSSFSCAEISASVLAQISRYQAPSVNETVSWMVLSMQCACNNWSSDGPLHSLATACRVDRMHGRRLSRWLRAK